METVEQLSCSEKAEDTNRPFLDRHLVNLDHHKVKAVINIIYYSVDIVMRTTGATNAQSFQPPKTDEIRSETVVTYV